MARCYCRASVVGEGGGAFFAVLVRARCMHLGTPPPPSLFRNGLPTLASYREGDGRRRGIATVIRLGTPRVPRNRTAATVCVEHAVSFSVFRGRGRWRRDYYYYYYYMDVYLYKYVRINIICIECKRKRVPRECDFSKPRQK